MHGDTFTASYCANCPSICAECPQPRLLPDALAPAAAFMACRTQWQHAANGLPTGLRYEDCKTPLRILAKKIGVPSDQRDELFEMMQIAERAFVHGVREAWHRERDKP